MVTKKTLVGALLCVASTTVGASVAANTTTASTASNSTRCDEELLFQKLYVLMPAINQCAKEADYYINTDALVLPTDAQLAKYCASANCTRLTSELDDAGLPSCTVAVGSTEVSFKEFFNQIKDHCANATVSKSKSAASTLGGRQTSGGWSVWLAVMVAVAVSAASM
ncbi:Elongator complex protein 1 [Globisporangium polare]